MPKVWADVFLLSICGEFALWGGSAVSASEISENHGQAFLRRAGGCAVSISSSSVEMAKSQASPMSAIAPGPGHPLPGLMIPLMAQDFSHNIPPPDLSHSPPGIPHPQASRSYINSDPGESRYPSPQIQASQLPPPHGRSARQSSPPTPAQNTPPPTPSLDGPSPWQPPPESPIPPSTPPPPLAYKRSLHPPPTISPTKPPPPHPPPPTPIPQINHHHISKSYHLSYTNSSPHNSSNLSSYPTSLIPSLSPPHPQTPPPPPPPPTNLLPEYFLPHIPLSPTPPSPPINRFPNHPPAWHGGAGDHRTRACRGGRATCSGLGVAGDSGLSPRRGCVAAGTPSCRSARRWYQPGTGRRAGAVLTVSPGLTQNAGGRTSVQAPLAIILTPAIRYWRRLKSRIASKNMTFMSQHAVHLTPWPFQERGQSCEQSLGHATHQNSKHAEHGFQFQQASQRHHRRGDWRPGACGAVVLNRLHHRRGRARRRPAAGQRSWEKPDPDCISRSRSSTAWKRFPSRFRRKLSNGRRRAIRG